MEVSVLAILQEEGAQATFGHFAMVRGYYGTFLKFVLIIPRQPWLPRQMPSPGSRIRCAHPVNDSLRLRNEGIEL
jgi:hypothetical protein